MGSEMCIRDRCIVPRIYFLLLQSDVGRFFQLVLRHSPRHVPEGNLVDYMSVVRILVKFPSVFDHISLYAHRSHKR